jgi:tetratricopeptide (TPR) repeat protein
MRNFISSAAIIAVFMLGSAHAEENWGYCTRSTNVSPELRIRDCTNRIHKFQTLDEGESFMRRGQAYLDSGQYRLAIADYDLASANGSQSIDALFQRGVAYALLKDFQHAEQDLDAALSWAEWAQRPANDPLLVRIKLARGLLVAVKNGIQGPDVLRQVVEATVHQEK